MSASFVSSSSYFFLVLLWIWCILSTALLTGEYIRFYKSSSVDVFYMKESIFRCNAQLGLNILKRTYIKGKKLFEILNFYLDSLFRQQNLEKICLHSGWAFALLNLRSWLAMSIFLLVVLHFSTLTIFLCFPHLQYFSLLTIWF